VAPSVEDSVECTNISCALSVSLPVPFSLQMCQESHTSHRSFASNAEIECLRRQVGHLNKANVQVSVSHSTGTPLAASFLPQELARATAKVHSLMANQARGVATGDHGAFKAYKVTSSICAHHSFFHYLCTSKPYHINNPEYLKYNFP
jgi:hypothetical protein